jgi:hypothetical protein
MRLTKQWAVTAAVVGSLIAAMSPGPTATAASQAEACDPSFRLPGRSGQPRWRRRGPGSRRRPAGHMAWGWNGFGVRDSLG